MESSSEAYDKRLPSLISFVTWYVASARASETERLAITSLACVHLHVMTRLPRRTSLRGHYCRETLAGKPPVEPGRPVALDRGLGFAIREGSKTVGAGTVISVLT